MKRLGSESGDAAWDADIVAQLGFIKKHLRYPISRRTAKPLSMLALLAPGIAFLIYSLIFLPSNSHYQGKAWLPLLIIGIMLAGAMATVVRYARTLRFTVVPGYRTAAENMLLVQRFLEENNFAVGRHPEMPEVFQIISRGIPSLNGAREVIVFIADDKRILINGHFTGKTMNMSVGRAHHRQMAAGLIDFIAKQARATNIMRAH